MGFSTDDDISNILKRTIVDDQIDVLGRIEKALDKGGLAGRQCVLRAVCELTETPIHHWTVFGEMLQNLLRPKNGTHEALDEYRKAETIGEEQGDCWSFYPQCPFSIFNIIPDVYTKDDQVKVTFDDFSAGSGTTKNGPDHDAPEPQGPPRGNGSDAKSKNDKKNKTTDNYEGDIFDADSDEHLNKLLKEFGASHDDVKEVKVDLNLTKP